jgi:hypothetical protein
VDISGTTGQGDGDALDFDIRFSGILKETDSTQLLHQPLHIYKICKILHIKTLKTSLVICVKNFSNNYFDDT